MAIAALVDIDFYWTELTAQPALNSEVLIDWLQVKAKEPCLPYYLIHDCEHFFIYIIHLHDLDKARIKGVIRN